MGGCETGMEEFDNISVDDRVCSGGFYCLPYFAKEGSVLYQCGRSGGFACRGYGDGASRSGAYYRLCYRERGFNDGSLRSHEKGQVRAWRELYSVGAGTVVVGKYRRVFVVYKRIPQGFLCSLGNGGDLDVSRIIFGKPSQGGAGQRHSLAQSCVRPYCHRVNLCIRASVAFSESGFSK